MNCKSLIANNCCYECASDLISFLVDRILKSFHIHVRNIENRPRITAARLPKMMK